MPGQLLQRGATPLGGFADLKEVAWELPQRTGFSARGCAVSERKSVSKSYYAAGFTRRCALAKASRRDGGSLRQATTCLR
ncbi:hypothetical protein [Nostoc sp.]|uniref:hypothetical protein n=1 Tax=Nostoc sp. TaxID=1180 RepID=UPI002FF933C7